MYFEALKRIRHFVLPLLALVALTATVACAQSTPSTTGSTSDQSQETATASTESQPSGAADHTNSSGSTATTEAPAGGGAASVATTPAPFSDNTAYGHVKHLASTIGSRPTGTEKEREAARYIASTLESYGYKVELQQFTFTSYQDLGSSLEVASPQSEKLNPRNLFFSAPGEVKGPLVAAGIGTQDNLAPLALRGSIALIERGTIPFSEKVANASAKGALAVIVYNNESGEVRGATLGKLSSIPAVSVSKEEGQKLLDLLKGSQVTVSLSVKALAGDIHSQNVVARGSDRCSVVVGGHYDSVPAGPGANDNASGTATVMEVARVSAPLAKSAALCFLAFGGEELGLWGSRHFVSTLDEGQRQAMKGMINLDMVAVGDDWRVTGSDKMVKLALDAAKEAQIEAQSFTMSGRSGSDHSSFINAGIPSVFIHRLDDPNYHTENDKTEFVQPKALGEAGRITLGVLKALIGL
ncbi:MAG: aminopeptidase [Dehalococcoidia bacterium]|nr:aminopeptidase [Dehalococcoidia bacterium]